MIIIRIVVFILCFYFIVPFDLYITSHHRLHYFGTDLYDERVTIGGVNQTNYTLNLQNCKVYLKLDDLQTNSFRLEYGFEFGTPFTFDQYKLDIKANPT